MDSYASAPIRATHPGSFLGVLAPPLERSPFLLGDLVDYGFVGPRTHPDGAAIRASDCVHLAGAAVISADVLPCRGGWEIPLSSPVAFGVAGGVPAFGNPALRVSKPEMGTLSFVAFQRQHRLVESHGRAFRTGKWGFIL